MASCWNEKFDEPFRSPRTGPIHLQLVEARSGKYTVPHKSQSKVGWKTRVPTSSRLLFPERSPNVTVYI